MALNDGSGKRARVLTDMAIRKALPKDKDYKMTDAYGLYVLIKLSGGKSFRWNYRFQGKQKTMTFGNYPEISLADAREIFAAKKALLRQGIDPMMEKKLAGLKNAEGLDTFKKVALEWFENMKNGAAWSPQHTQRISTTLYNRFFPYIGTIPIVSIEPSMLLDPLRKIEREGYLEATRKAKIVLSQVFEYARATARLQYNPTSAINRAFAPPQTKHMAALIEPQDVAGLLRAIDRYRGGIIVQHALLLAPLVFTRPGELRQAEWSELDFTENLWRVPADKMKNKKDLLVPLASQSITILRAIQPFTGNGKYVFPSPRTASRPMSDNAILAALRRMGFEKDEMCGHGFRSMASTLLREVGDYPGEIVEIQLAHSIRNQVEAAYNRAKFLKQRREMMQWWADYLDELRTKYIG